MTDIMSAIHRKIPFRAKIEPLLAETKALIRDGWGGMTADQRRALETSVAGFEAALRSIKNQELIADAREIGSRDAGGSIP